MLYTMTKRLLLTILGTILMAGLAPAADIVYTKDFPGSVPAYVHITLSENGQVSYKEAPDEEPLVFQLEEPVRAEMFKLADELQHFDMTLESGLKVAKMGTKTFRWVDGSSIGEATYNHTNEKEAQQLQGDFDHIAESENLLFALERAVRYDRLGVHEALLNIENAWDKKRLVGTSQFLPLMAQVRENEAFLHMARERAARLTEEINKVYGE